MRICIIIPFFNEAKHLEQVLSSFVAQDLIPDKLILVDDNSTDSGVQIAQNFAQNYSWIYYTRHNSKAGHAPGAKVVRAFNYGLESVNIQDYQLVGKFDADVIIPKNYFNDLVALFNSDSKIGIASGLLYIKKGQTWQYEAIAKKSKVRGPIKLYRTDCLKEIGGLKESMGWDTADVLLAHFFGWKTQTLAQLKVKHLRPTASQYPSKDAFKQGQTFYLLGYGPILGLIAALKLSVKKGSLGFFFNCLKGFFKMQFSKTRPLLTSEQVRFARSYRWQDMGSKESN